MYKNDVAIMTDGSMDYSSVGLIIQELTILLKYL